MANVLLTEKCVRACPYCFAKEYLKESKENMLSWENLIYIADLFEDIEVGSFLATKGTYENKGFSVGYKSFHGR